MRVQIRFVGRVQGVGFRATARWVASRHAVTGWVRNEADGSVVLEVQGRADGIDAYLLDLNGAMEGRALRQDRVQVAEVEGERAFTVVR